MQGDRVLRDIIGRRLLNNQQLAYSAYVWVRSWGFNRRTTRFPVHLKGDSGFCAWSGMDRRNAQRVRAELVRRRVIVVHPDGSEEFNEHWETWLGAVKSTALVYITSVSGGASIVPPLGAVKATAQGAVKLTALGAVEQTHFCVYYTAPLTVLQYSMQEKKQDTAASPRPRTIDPVWKYFSQTYCNKYGNGEPIFKVAYLAQLKILRESKIDDEIKGRVSDLFNWEPEWHKGERWTFFDLVKWFDRIPSSYEPGEFSL